MDVYTIDIEEQLKVLRDKALPVEDIDGRIKDLAENMISTMTSADGIGLAGPQVGLKERLFVVRLEHQDPLVFINPEITGTSEDVSSYEEGCLSIPGMFAEVRRPAVIEVQAWNLRGRPFRLEAAGLLSTVIQHELDHLNGTLFSDYLSDAKREKLVRRFMKERQAG